MYLWGINQELYMFKLCNFPDIVKKIRARQLRWAGLVERIDDNVVSNKLYLHGHQLLRKVCFGAHTMNSAEKFK